MFCRFSGIIMRFIYPIKDNMFRLSYCRSNILNMFIMLNNNTALNELAENPVSIKQKFIIIVESINRMFFLYINKFIILDMIKYIIYT